MAFLRGVSGGHRKDEHAAVGSLLVNLAALGHRTNDRNQITTTYVVLADAETQAKPQRGHRQAVHSDHRYEWDEDRVHSMPPCLMSAPYALQRRSGGST